jgi:hypothetical protein
VIVRDKVGGANPGFTAKDAKGETWFLGFDLPGRLEANSGAVVVASKLFWAFGYNLVELFITKFDPATATFDPEAVRQRPSGARTPFTRDDMEEVLERAAKNPDGTYRVAAGRLLPGKVLGPFRYEGTRPDDPNDIVPHEHRRELRALRVFGAWTNMVDMKAANTLDTLVTENGRGIIKHVLQDVGTALGTANREYEWDFGYEHFLEFPASRRRLLTFGFALSPWQTVDYTEYPSIGRFEGDEFDPTAWKAQSPIKAIMELRADDAFWAARRVMAFDDALIRAAVHTGEYSDPAAERHLIDVLIKRRNKIGQTYLTAVNPIVDPRLDAGGQLTFRNAAVDAGFAPAPSAYRASWSRFDNATGVTQPIGESRAQSTSMAPPAGLPAGRGSFVEVDISSESEAHPSWRQPVKTFFRRDADGWKLVGLERLPEKIDVDDDR